MGIILDLDQFREETADVRLMGGAVAHLKKPTEKLVIHLLQLKDVDETKPPEVILSALNRMATEILNNNADGVTFDLAEVSKLDTDMKTRLLKAYSDWASALQANPTSPRQESQAGAAAKGKRSFWSRFTRWRNTRD